MSTLASENIRKNDRKRYLLAVVALIVVGGLAGGIYFGYQSYWRQTPRFALWQMVQAMQSNDTQTLFQFIDLSAVVDSIVQQSSGDIENWLLPKGLDLPDDQLTRFGRQLTKKFARFLGPKLVVALEPQIKTGVAKYLAELHTAERAALTALPAQAQIRQEDGSAWVTLKIPNSDQSIRFRMQRPENSHQWRIVEVDYHDLRKLLDRQLSP